MNQTRLWQRWRCALWQRQYRTRAIRHIRINFQVRPVLRIGRLPLHLVAFELATVTDERRFGGECEHLGFLARPVVVHALGILGVTHQTRDVQLAVDLKLITYDAHDRDVLACPIVLLEHLVTVGLAPLDSLGIDLAGAQWLNAHLLHLLGFGRTLESRDVAGVQVERSLLVLDVVILGDANCILIYPDRD